MKYEVSWVEDDGTTAQTNIEANNLSDAAFKAAKDNSLSDGVVVTVGVPSVRYRIQTAVVGVEIVK